MAVLRIFLSYEVLTWLLETLILPGPFRGYNAKAG